MVNLSPSALTAWACLLMLTTASPLVSEKNDKYTIYKRQQQASVPGGNPPVNPLLASAMDGQIPRKFIETKCDAGKKFKITEAWKEAKLLADAQTKFVLGYNYDIPHTQWLGKDWNSEASWIPWRKNYRKLIGDNFGRLARVFSNNAQKKEYIYWYCYDYGNQCTEGVQAYSWDSLGFFWSNHYTVFCPPFYDRATLPDQIAKYANNPHEQKVMENFHLSRGQIMFHEVWHYKDLVSSPRTDDYAYQAQPVWNLAKDKGTSWSYVNADSYALDGVAIYVQQHYKSSMSPVPWRELGKLDAAAAAATSQPPADNAVGKTFTGTPPGWIGPLSNTETPDPAVWEEVKDGGSSETSSGTSSGTCKLAITEKWTCEAVDSNLYASVVITGADGKVLYTTPQSAHSPGQPINAGHSLSLQEPGMKNPLVITGEHRNDYIQFQYGPTQWQSGTTGGNAHCALKGNDWNKAGPQGCPQGMMITRDFDCEFPC